MRANPTRLLSNLRIIGAIGLLLTLNACFLFGGGGKKKDEQGLAQQKQTDAEKNFVTTYEVGQTMANAGRYDDALLIYQEALAQDSLGLVGARSLDAMGDIYITMLDYDKSIQAFQRIVTEIPTYLEIERVNKKLAFAKTAQEVRDQRLKIAKEGPSFR